MNGKIAFEATSLLALVAVFTVQAETVPWTVDSSEKRHVAEYAPPVLANGDLGMLVDYRNCQFQDVKSYESLRSVAGEYFPATCRAGRRTMDSHLVTFGRAEEEVWVGGKNEAPRHWKQFLDVFRGESVVENDYADEAHVDSTALVAQNPAPFAAHGKNGSVFAVEKRFRGPVEKYVFKWVFRRPGLSGLEPVGVQYAVKPGEIAWKVARPQKKIAGGLAGKPVYIDTTLRGTVTLRCSDPSAALDCEADMLRVTLTRPQGVVAFFVSFTDSMDDKKAVRAADCRRRGVLSASEKEDAPLSGRGEDTASTGLYDFATLRAEHEANWKAFWGDFYVRIPDKALERTYYTALYNLKCWSTRWTTPIGIQPMHWEGKYFGYGFNARAFAGAGKLEEAKRIGRFWASLAAKARSRAASRRESDVDSGMRYAWQALEDGEEGGPSGRWLDHYMHLGAISADCWHAYCYSGDRAFLQEVYPVIRGLAQYFRAWLVQETRDGRTIIGPVCDLERLPCPARNACLTTCAAIGNFEKAAAAAAVLGVDATWIPEWKRLAAELRRDLPKKDGRFLAFEGCEEVSHGTITGLFPFDAVPREDPVMRASVDYFAANGVRGGNPYKIGTRICTWYAACIGADYAKMLDGENALKYLQLANASVGFFHEIYEINEPVYKSVPWCQAPQGTLIQAVHDMLVQEVDGELRVAPAVPASWKDYAFRLLAPGNRIVEATCVGGKLEWHVVDR